MPLTIASLNSGSNGNCYYIGNDRDAVLIDAGLPCRDTENRLTRMGLSFDTVRAIFISHEHTDHTRGAEAISRRYRLPVYMTEATHHKSGLMFEEGLHVPFRAYEPVSFGDLVVNPFPKQHDGCDPHSFTITGEEVTIGVFTDIGSVCEHVIRNFRLCHAVFLEANYDEIMLDEGRYPVFLKRRIRSSVGHLSNRQALELFMAHRPPFMTHLLLSHLSQDNNDPARVLGLFSKFAGETEISIASRHEESPVFQITAEPGGSGILRHTGYGVATGLYPEQLKLF